MDTFERCPACGDPIDYCQGHGPMGDPQGYAVIRLHDDDIIDYAQAHGEWME